MVRFRDGEFVEVYVSTSLKTCEKRDPKDLYKKVKSRFEKLGLRLGLGLVLVRKKVSMKSEWVSSYRS